METELQKDYKELLRSLNSKSVRYLLIGGYAVIFHGYPRFTHDLDIVISNDHENLAKCIAALNDFGFTGPDVSVSLFTKPKSVVRMGIEPVMIELLNYIKGLDFDDAYSRRDLREVEDITVSLISLSDLIKNKLTVARDKDIADVTELRKRNEELQ